MKLLRHCLLFALLLAFFGALALGAEKRRSSSESDDEKLYRGLIELKLLDLLDYALRTDPPADELTRLLLQREVRLVVARDPLQDPARRRAALEEANSLLERVIAERPGDKRCFQWRLSLANSMLYDEGEPYYSRILYRGGTPADREALGALMARVRKLLVELDQALTAEYARLDEVSIAEYERLEDSGYVAEIEAASPQAEYMLRWANFYAAIALEPDDPERQRLLEEIAAELTADSPLVRIEHSVSHVQAQSLLLAGMANRRLASNEAAVRYLQDAADVARSILDPAERRDLAWVVMLAGIERVRALRDMGRIEDAESALAELRRRLPAEGGADFGQELVMAVLATSLVQARGGATGEAVLSAPMSDAAVRPLAELAERGPSERDAVYAALYDQLRRVENERKLHPFQQCALIAGLIGEASQLRRGGSGGEGATDQAGAEAQAVALLDRAIALATDLASLKAAIEQGVYCEALYNRAVAEFHRGLRADASAHFADVAVECPQFSRALPAATYSVELAAQLVQDRSLRARKDVQDLYLRALRTLVEQFPESDAARYWRFFYAQALEDLKQFDEAKAQYAAVSTNHDMRVVAEFRAARTQSLAVAELPANTPEERDLVRSRAQAARKALEQFEVTTASLVHAPPGVDLARLRAEAVVLRAELCLLSGVDRAGEALAILEDFESRHEGFRDLIGRVLRSRIVAYEATGRLQEAQQAVPTYIASAPNEAGPTLQSLFEATREEIERLQRQKRTDEARSKARGAVLFAEQLYNWGSQKQPPLSPADLYVLRLQWAEALRLAGRHAEALPMFRQCAEFDAARQPDGVTHELRVLLGLAQTLADAGQHAEALPLFNRAFREAPADAVERFQALLGDLTARTELGEDPKGIVAAIRQHRFLSPELGGPELKEAFAALQQRNEARQRQAERAGQSAPAG